MLFQEQPIPSKKYREHILTVMSFTNIICTFFMQAIFNNTFQEHELGPQALYQSHNSVFNLSCCATIMFHIYQLKKSAGD